MPSDFSRWARPEAVHVTGSMKFDRRKPIATVRQSQRLRALAGIAADDIVFLAGSTQEPEESLALDAFRRLSRAHPRLRLVLVPRHPERFHSVAAMLVAAGVRWQRRTELDHGRPDPLARVLLVDVVGELGAWWGTARIGFVGGSLSSRGGQNMIEPAAFGVATSFGPNTQNFRDVVAALLVGRCGRGSRRRRRAVRVRAPLFGRRRLRRGARPPRTKLRRCPARRDNGAR